MEKYKFRQYNKNFTPLYRKELARLRKLLPGNARIEHIGSSAVNGLRGKGIIDIVIAVPKGGISSAKRLLERGKYVVGSKHRGKERIFFQRDYVSTGKARRVHLHLTHHNSKTFIGMVAVRDYLGANKNEARKYEELKRNAVKKAKGDGKKYRKLKDQYLKRLTKKAINEWK